ncbi:Cloroperoxidase [Hesseltinella vesiculosa]|uniref:Cloroperoxidase n=1 Tax=Hesseltinella vesiculosa TaxID=101127 RepID=A0A1X2GTC2_9FUNG|nr:Cloroperoxidase [Hesseltinella vesiculosa]
MVVGSIRLELKGHRATKTHEEWDVYIKDHPFQRHDTDARGPCPMLNLLANHGLISRDGRNISKQELFDALMIVGAPPTITWMFLSTAVYPMYRDISPSDPFYANFLPAAYLNLDQLTIHNMIEHDVSLTRYDVDIPPHTDLSIPQPDLVRRIHDWAMLQQQFNNDNQVVLNMEGEHDLRKIRWFESFNDNPKSHLSLMYQISSSAECALLLDVIGRNGQLRADQIESLLLKEQFPHDWYPREKSMPAWQAVLRPMQCLYGLRNSKANLQSLDALQSDQ